MPPERASRLAKAMGEPGRPETVDMEEYMSLVVPRVSCLCALRLRWRVMRDIITEVRQSSSLQDVK